MNPLLNTAIKASHIAGDIIMRGYDRLDTIAVTEKTYNDYVTEIDKRSEEVIIDVLRTAYPDHGILAEESGAAFHHDDYTWIIDPLDGTRNFVHGFPHFCVSIALQIKGKIEHGVIYDPVRQETFTATRGSGVYLNYGTGSFSNNRRLRVSTRLKLAHCLLGTGFPFRHEAAAREGYFKLFKAFMPVCGDLRRTGSAALDLAYVASGRLDGFFEMHLKPWDIAAGSLMVKEAGGLLSDFDGGENYMQSGDVLCANPKIFKQIAQVIRTL